MTRGRTPNIGLEVSEKEVGRDLKDDVWDEEDGQSDIGLVCFGVEMQVLGQA